MPEDQDINPTPMDDNTANINDLGQNDAHHDQLETEPTQHKEGSENLTSLTGQTEDGYQEIDLEMAIAESQVAHTAHDTAVLALGDGLDVLEHDDIDISGYDKQGLLQLLEAILKENRILDTARLVTQARLRYKELLDQERKTALEAFLAQEGNTEADFSFSYHLLDRQWKDAIRNYTQRKKTIRESFIAEREDNLKKKLALLETLKQLTDNATMAGAFDTWKKLQDDWRSIGQVPLGEMDNLNRNYRFLTDKFFEQRALIKEFQEYDRKKNLEVKLDIIASLQQLAESKDDLRDLQKHLRTLQDGWRDAGPVPREHLDETMDAYRNAVEKILALKNGMVETLEASRQENLAKKLLVLEKISKLSDDANTQSWAKRNNGLAKLIAEWKEIGAVPKAENNKLRHSFNEVVKEFNHKKNNYFKEQKKEQNTLVDARMAMIQKVQELVDSQDDPKAHRPTVVQLQRDWRTLGMLPRKQADALWEQFKTVCNAFFDKLKEGDKAKLEEENANLREKESICEQIEKLREDPEANAESLAPLDHAWANIGYVPLAQKANIEKRYKQARAAVLAKNVKLGEVPAELADYKVKVQTWVGQGQGGDQIDQELQMVKKRLVKLENELNTLETNILFFSNSKGADALTAPIKKQIDALKNEQSLLKDKEKLLKRSLQHLKS
ncbi:MAG: DUF349 domain-containing protein [Bacteroidetes bacterium]|nr:DUF349 domain-containing protein [Bacteroidota bacterium]